MTLPRLAVVCDFIEEGWPSMDLVTDSLLARLESEYATTVQATRICPRMRLRATRLASRALNVDRLLNRFWDYPRHLARLRAAYDIFHVGDHSYAQLVHVLPEERTGVFCHDLDAFRCLLEPEIEARPAWFRAMTRRVLAGLQKAAIVFCSTSIVRAKLTSLVDQSRIVHVPYGLAPEFSFRAEEREPFLLHVGSCIERKRIDVLLETFAALRRNDPGLRLVQIGGTWTREQSELIEALGLREAVTQRRGLERTELAGIYRRAQLVLQPSEREGFGLPTIEALACGAVVLASDIPVLREVGGEAFLYAPVGDLGAWASLAARLLRDPKAAPALEARLRWAGRYSWSEHARLVLESYKKLL